MDIRSVTLFCEPDYSPEAAHRFFTTAPDALPAPTQTRRVALPPFPEWWLERETAGIQAAEIASHWREAGSDYVCLGPVQLHHDAAWLPMLTEVLGRADMVFAGAEVADTQGQIDTERARAIATVIRSASTLQENGFGNLYFTALANCPPGSPFFPVAYHGGGPPRFALAVEAADLAVTAFRGARSLAEARKRLVTAIEEQAATLSRAANELAAAHDIAFDGIDFSLAPFPTGDKSLAGAIEALGVPWIGASGSLFAAAFVAEAIGRADFRRCGFSGLMLTVLEDSVLAARAGEGTFTVNDLLSYAAVCGLGLDTVPLPGNVSEESLTAILLDVAALAVRVDKPLTARLMPLPGLEAGDPARFDFPYFADSRVMSVAGSGASGLMAKPARLAFDTVHGHKP